MSENLPGNDPVQPAQPAPAYAGGVPGAPATQPKGLAVTSLVLGIVSVVLAWWLGVVANIAGIVGLVLGVVGLVLGIVGRRKGQSSSMTLWGIILSALGIVLGIVAIIVVAAIIGSALSDPTLQQQLQDLE